MAKLKILKFPSPKLRIKAKEIKDIDKKIKIKIDDMFETMYDAPGIGLAATQVDFHYRLLVADVSSEQNEPLVMINPIVNKKEGVAINQEGCLSIPGYFGDVERAKTIWVSYLDGLGNKIDSEFDGLLSVCVQHEIDHLDGKLFLDHLSEAKRQRIRKSIDKEKRQRTKSSKSNI